MDPNGVKQPFDANITEILWGSVARWCPMCFYPSGNNSQLVTPRHLSGGFNEAIVTRIWQTGNDGSATFCPGWSPTKHQKIILGGKFTMIFTRKTQLQLVRCTNKQMIGQKHMNYVNIGGSPTENGSFNQQNPPATIINCLYRSVWKLASQLSLAMLIMNCCLFIK